jgi:hypothetical protein
MVADGAHARACGTRAGYYGTEEFKVFYGTFESVLWPDVVRLRRIFPDGEGSDTLASSGKARIGNKRNAHLLYRLAFLGPNDGLGKHV